HPRCPYVMERCRTDEPPLLRLNDRGGRGAACWLQDGSVPVPAQLAVPVPATDLGASLAPPLVGSRPSPRPGGAPPRPPPERRRRGGAPSPTTSPDTARAAPGAPAP